MSRRKLAAGNWKMNGTKASAAELERMLQSVGAPNCDVLICPPMTVLAALADSAAGAPVQIGAQDCHAAASGAHTGDVSAEMIKDAGGAAIIVGHSERRADHGETDEMVRAKAEAAWRAGLIAIICVGETEAERDAGDAVAVVTGQVAGSVPAGATAANTVVAYEPVWAIGTGRTPSLDDIGEMHDALHAKLVETFPGAGEGIRLLYGGSVKPGNAAEIFAVPNVDGGLVGGASLKAADFLPIIQAASDA
ncbi:MAG: triose-phosphate isomerase [Pseudomonadota bacterium]